MEYEEIKIAISTFMGGEQGQTQYVQGSVGTPHTLQ